MLINIRYDTHRFTASILRHMQQLQSHHLAGSCTTHRSGSCSLITAEGCVNVTAKPYKDYFCNRECIWCHGQECYPCDCHPSMLAVPGDPLSSLLTGCCCLYFQCNCSYIAGRMGLKRLLQLSRLSCPCWYETCFIEYCTHLNEHGLLRVLAHKYHQLCLVAGNLDRCPTNAFRLGQRVAGAASLLKICVLRFSKAHLCMKLRPLV